MRHIFRKLFQLIYRPFALRQIKRDNSYNRNGLELWVPKGVFHPGLFFSSEILANFISRQPILNKKLLEIGCGSGYISLVAAKHGAKVITTDINPLAVDTTKRNALANDLEISVVESDLFESLPKQRFDFIVINPPYYRKAAKSMSEHAWFAGKNLEYFDKLFTGLSAYIGRNSRVYMCASEDVEIETIKSTAAKNKFRLETVLTRKIWFEKNYVYQLIFSF